METKRVLKKVRRIEIKTVVFPRVTSSPANAIFGFQGPWYGVPAVRNINTAMISGYRWNVTAAASPLRQGVRRSVSATR